MILQSVPSEDYEEDPQGNDDESEDATLYGVSSSSAKAPCPKTSDNKTKKICAIKRKVGQVAKGTDHPQQAIFLGVVFAVCCCVGVVATGTFLALLGRYGEEVGGDNNDVFLAIFSFSAAADTIVAWLSAAVVQGDVTNISKASDGSNGVAFSPFIAFSANSDRGLLLPDENLVKVWNPELKITFVRAVVHGGVANFLRRVHHLDTPQVFDLSGGSGPMAPSTAGGENIAGSVAEVVPEVDAFLSLRNLVDQGATAQPEREDGNRRLAETHKRRLLIISHPHHLPYLFVLAWASGFQPVSLPMSVYTSLPWEDFALDRLGYPIGENPETAVRREMDLLSKYQDAVQTGDEVQFRRLQPILSAANTTLCFHLCVAKHVGNFTATKPIGNATAVSGGMVRGSGRKVIKGGPRRLGTLESAVQSCRATIRLSEDDF